MDTPVNAPADKPSVLLRCAAGLFGIGMLLVVVIFVLFAVGKHDLPTWISVTAIVLSGVGFALGLVALVREARS